MDCLENLMINKVNWFDDMHLYTLRESAYNLTVPLTMPPDSQLHCFVPASPLPSSMPYLPLQLTIVLSCLPFSCLLLYYLSLHLSPVLASPSLCSHDTPHYLSGTPCWSPLYPSLPPFVSLNTQKTLAVVGLNLQVLLPV